MQDTIKHTQCLVSVVLLTYNSSWERVRASLNSALRQKGIDFEILVSDDGSKDNHFDKIKALFQKYSFTNYRLLAHEKNQGTVLNYLDAVKLSQGSYIRGLGQGDMFFDEYALRDSYEHIVAKKADVTVCKAVYFEVGVQPVKLVAYHRHPKNFKAYEDMEQLKYAYLIQRDNVLGAATFYKRDILLKYLEEENAAAVKYLEDFFFFLMVFDGVKFAFLDKNIVYYEFGDGISTSGEDSWVRRLREEEQIFWGLLLKRCESCPQDSFAATVKFLITEEGKGTLPLPFVDWETSVKILLRDGIADFTRKCEILKGIKGKYQSPLTLWGKIRRRIELLKVPEVFFYLLRTRFFPEKMTDTNVSTAFAELCLSRE